MEKVLKIVTIILIVFASLCGALFFVDLDLYQVMIKEDGVLENITAIFLLIGSLFLFYRLIKTYKLKEKKWIFFNLLIAIGLFFGFGEEISWGQRIFSIESSEFFSENNLQNETNLHNLKIYGVKLNRVIFSQGFSLIFGVYFLLSLWLMKKQQWFKKLVDDFGVPIPQVKHSVIFLGLTIVIACIPDGKIWEVWEVLFVLTLFWILLEPYNTEEKLILD